MKPTNAKVAIIMGSDSDLGIMRSAADAVKQFGIEYEMMVISAHRNPMDAINYASSAHERGIRVIIAGAGGAAHLPGVLAGNTVLPVIGVPVLAKSLSGMDSLFSIVQMPPGVPVATVGIDGAKNAGLLAVQILAIADDELSAKYSEFKKKLSAESRAKNDNPEFTKL